MENKVDLSMFLDFNSSINFLKKFKEKLDIFNDDNWNKDVYNENTYNILLGTMPFFYLDADKEFDNNIKLEYNLLRTIPWHYDFNIYEKVLDELDIIKKDDLWENFRHAKKYISNYEESKTKNYNPNIAELRKYIPRGYLIPPIDKENITIKIQHSQHSTRLSDNIISDDDCDITERPVYNTNIDKLYYKIINDNDRLTKQIFLNFIDNNKDFFDKIIQSSFMLSSYDDIIGYYFDDGKNFINLCDFKEKTLVIINYDSNYELLLNNLVNKKKTDIIENFSTETSKPINDKTNRPVNFFNFTNKSWEKKLINMTLWLFLYILVIIFIIVIVISFIK